MRLGNWLWKEDGCRTGMYDIGWSDGEKCRGCDKEEGTEKHRLYHCPCLKQVRNQFPEKLGNWEQRVKTSKKGWKWQRGITSYPQLKASRASRSSKCRHGDEREDMQEQSCAKLVISAFNDHNGTPCCLRGMCCSTWKSSARRMRIR